MRTAPPPSEIYLTTLVGSTYEAFEYVFDGEGFYLNSHHGPEEDSI